MVDIIPGILETEWSVVEQRIGLVAPYVQWIQIDFADNTLVPNLTLLDIAKFSQITKAYAVSPGGKLSFEAHLMVSKPETYVRRLADAGFGRIIGHVEAADPRVFLEACEYEDVEVGLALDGPTELEAVEPFLGEIDCVLVMTIEAGRSGQPFLPETIEKVKAVSGQFVDLPIEVDGGINEQTAKLVKDAGASRLVSTSFIFKNPQEISRAVEKLKNA